MQENSGIEYDQLTGLYNRWHHHVEVQRIIDARLNRVFFVLDIDGFRHINEQYGTAMGDLLLNEVAQALIDVHPTASIARVAGDEFSVILPPLPSSRYQMSLMTKRLYDRLHSIQVAGIDHMFEFSIGSVYIDPQHHTTADAVYFEARSYRLMAKEHEGSYQCSAYGNVPDVEGAFLILREDRTLYNHISDRLFRIHDEADWMAYLSESASVKSNIFKRNQSQLDDILAYYRMGDCPDYDYERLFQLVCKYANYLDAFMFEMLIGGILLPYYETRDVSDTSVRSRLGHLYLLLADNLISVFRMGDRSQRQRIVSLLQRCFDVCRGLAHGSIQFEPYYFALCEMVGHFESLEMQFVDVETCDRYYEELRELTLGSDPISFPDQEVLLYFDHIVNNARLFPLYRAFHLRLMENRLTVEQQQELRRRCEYIRNHLVDGVYDMAGDNPEYRNMATYLQGMLLTDIDIDEIVRRLLEGLRVVHHMAYGTMSESNLVIVAYLFLSTAQALRLSKLPDEQKRQIAISGVEFMIELFRNRETIASDHELLFMTQVLVRTMITTPGLRPSDKLFYLEHAIAAIMLDTYSHSKAVSEYAKVILTNIIDHNPELLAGEGRPYKSVEEVHRNREALIDFMQYACLLHDVGKLSITPITSNSYRRLTASERELICCHPQAGVEILRHEPAFEPFLPIIFGHHRWCNGEAGYPAVKPDEPHTPLKILIEILCFCDSMEAATSHIGRMYRTPKSFLQILDEFYSEAGTRYSSEVLHSIIGSPDTYYALRQMIDYRWQDIYRNIFQQVVKAPNLRHNLEALPQTFPSLYSSVGVSAKSSDAPSISLPIPEWYHHIDPESRQLYNLSLIERNRMSVQQNGISIFVYNALTDRLCLHGTDDQGKVFNLFNMHYSDHRLGVIISNESYQRTVEALHRVVNDPTYPREGRLKFESSDKSRIVLATYTSVVDSNGRVLSVVGQLEDQNTSRPKLLQTIQRQNKYMAMFDALNNIYITTLYTDVTLHEFEVVKCMPSIYDTMAGFTTTRQLVEYASERLVDAEFRQAFIDFCDPASITQRLAGKSRITLEYHSRISGWLRAHLVPAAYDEHNQITHVLFLAESAEAEHQQRAFLAHAAHYDSLTGIYNRMKGEEVIREQIAMGGTQIFAILDCDHFKRINDLLSHLVGDKVLRELGKAIQEHFHEFNTMRLGGDEFVVHLNGDKAHHLIYSFNGIRNCFQNFANRIAEIRIPELENIAPTLSCGVVFTDGSVDGITFEDLYQHADDALRQSKAYRNGTATISELRYRDFYH